MARNTWVKDQDKYQYTRIRSPSHLSLSAVALVSFEPIVCVSLTGMPYIVQSLVFLTQLHVGCFPGIFDTPKMCKLGADRLCSHAFVGERFVNFQRHRSPSLLISITFKTYRFMANTCRNNRKEARVMVKVRVSNDRAWPRVVISMKIQDARMFVERRIERPKVDVFHLSASQQEKKVLKVSWQKRVETDGSPYMLESNYLAYVSVKVLEKFQNVSAKSILSK